MAEGDSEVKRPRLSDSARVNKVALITGITGQVWGEPAAHYLVTCVFVKLLLHVGWIIFG